MSARDPSPASSAANRRRDPGPGSDSEPLVGALPTRSTDAVLVGRAQRGERWAQEALFRRYVGPLTGLLTKLLGCEADADDVTQDAFFEALGTLSSLREPEAFRGWLYQIALNRARKKLRRHRLRSLLGLDCRLEDAALSVLASSETSPEMLVELRLLERVLTKLSPDERIAWMLRHVEGESVDTIAAWLEVSYATAKRRIMTAQVTIDAHVAGRAT